MVYIQGHTKDLTEAFANRRRIILNAKAKDVEKIMDKFRSVCTFPAFNLSY